MLNFDVLTETRNQTKGVNDFVNSACVNSFGHRIFVVDIANHIFKSFLVEDFVVWKLQIEDWTVKSS